MNSFFQTGVFKIKDNKLHLYIQENIENQQLEQNSGNQFDIASITHLLVYGTNGVGIQDSHSLVDNLKRIAIILDRFTGIKHFVQCGYFFPGILLSEISHRIVSIKQKITINEDLYDADGNYVGDNALANSVYNDQKINFVNLKQITVDAQFVQESYCKSAIKFFVLLCDCIETEHYLFIYIDMFDFKKFKDYFSGKKRKLGVILGKFPNLTKVILKDIKNTYKLKEYYKNIYKMVKSNRCRIASKLILHLIVEEKTIKYNRCKLVFIGDVGVGKTWIKNKICNIKFKISRGSSSQENLKDHCVINVNTRGFDEKIKWKPNKAVDGFVFKGEFLKLLEVVRIEDNANQNNSSHIISERDIKEGFQSIQNYGTMSTSPKMNHLLNTAFTSLCEENPVAYTEKPLKFSVWDFGGEKIFHTHNNLFLSKNCIVLLVFDMSRFKYISQELSELSRLSLLYRNIKLYAPESEIHLIGTHLDKVKKATKFSVFKSKEPSVFEQIERKFKESGEFKSLRIFPIDNLRLRKGSKKLKVIRDFLEKITNNDFYTENIDREIPLIWFLILEEIGFYYSHISYKNFKRFSNKYNVELDSLLEFFTSVGAITHFDIYAEQNRREELIQKEIIFVKPGILVRVLVKILFTLEKETSNYDLGDPNLNAKFETFRKSRELDRELLHIILGKVWKIESDRKYIEDLLLSLLMLCRYGRKYFVFRLGTQQIVPGDSFLDNADTSRYFKVDFEPLLPFGLFAAMVSIFIRSCAKVKTPPERFQIFPHKFSFFFSYNKDTVAIYLLQKDNSLRLYLGKGSYYMWLLSIAGSWLKRALELVLRDSKAKLNYSILTVIQRIDTISEIDIEQVNKTFIDSATENTVHPVSENYIDDHKCFVRDMNSMSTPIDPSEGEQFDGFLSHAWGPAENGGFPDHTRVKKLHQDMKKKV
eukprot:snap_masked-scaffold_54-processed-gene-1.50-mRNA-1 protein AED:1.00 eAED:1.00 QI:0/0/0/0/1/1/5/0/929